MCHQSEERVYSDLLLGTGAARIHFTLSLCRYDDPGSLLISERNNIWTDLFANVGTPCEGWLHAPIVIAKKK